MGRPKRYNYRTILPELNQSQTFEPSVEQEEDEIPLAKIAPKKP